MPVFHGPNESCTDPVLRAICETCRAGQETVTESPTSRGWVELHPVSDDPSENHAEIDALLSDSDDTAVIEHDVPIRRCYVCSADISHKRKQAKTCSARCRMEMMRHPRWPRLRGKIPRVDWVTQWRDQKE